MANSDRSTRFQSSLDELSVVEVDRTLQVVKRTFQILSTSKHNILVTMKDNPAIYAANELWETKKQAILGVPQDENVRKQITTEEMKALHISLIAYTFDGKGELYTNFNAKTRELFLGKITLQQYPYAAYLGNIYAATALLRGTPVFVPEFLYRGVTKGRNQAASTLPTGKIFTFPQMLSTTANYEKALNFAGGSTGILFAIEMRGAKFDAIGLRNHSNFQGEEEFLFTPAHSFKVIKHVPFKGTLAIHLTVMKLL